MFKWTCYGTALIATLLLLLLLYDLKRDVTASLETAETAISEANSAVEMINDQLPAMVDEVKQGTQTLAKLAEDVELIKSVAGMQGEESQRSLRSLATYADDIQKVLAQQTEGKQAKILVEEIFGSDLKEVSTVDEFLVGLSKEMVTVILPLAKSKQEILYRTTHSSPPRRKPFYIQVGDTEPVPLEQFIKQHHSESADLPNYEVD